MAAAPLWEQMTDDAKAFVVGADEILAKKKAVTQCVVLQNLYTRLLVCQQLSVWGKNWLANVASAGGVFKKFKTEKVPKGKWNKFWKDHGDEIKAVINIGEKSQADRYIIIHDANEEGVIEEMYQDDWSNMPSSIVKLKKAIKKHLKSDNDTVDNQPNDLVHQAIAEYFHHHNLDYEMPKK